MTDNLSILSDSEQGVIHTITMRLNTKQALQYLRGVGIDMSERTCFRHKKKVESMKRERLMHIASLFTDQHLQTIDKLELVEHLMWTEFENRRAPLEE